MFVFSLGFDQIVPQKCWYFQSMLILQCNWCNWCDLYSRATYSQKKYGVYKIANRGEISLDFEFQTNDFPVIKHSIPTASPSGRALIVLSWRNQTSLDPFCPKPCETQTTKRTVPWWSFLHGSSGKSASDLRREVGTKKWPRLSLRQKPDLSFLFYA